MFQVYGLIVTVFFRQEGTDLIFGVLMHQKKVSLSSLAPKYFRICLLAKLALTVAVYNFRELPSQRVKSFNISKLVSLKVF